MVREYTNYICEICGSEYEYYEYAKECEKRGIPTPRFKAEEIVTAKYYTAWLLHSRPAKIIEIVEPKIYGEYLSHKATCYKIQFLQIQDRIDRSVKDYYGFDNLEIKEKDARIRLYKKKNIA